LSSLAVEAFKTLNILFEQLEKAGFDCECDGHSLAFDSLDGRPYLLNYHGVTQQIWLASPLTGAHHFRLQNSHWISTRGTDDLMTLLETELAISLS
jgi:iron donor protein CyaY